MPLYFAQAESVERNGQIDRLDESLVSEIVGYSDFSLIHEGGSGCVLRALDSLLERVVAIKVIRSQGLDQDTLRRLQREAKALAGLKHPNIVEIYKLGATTSGNSFLVMEYLEGRTLRAYCRQDARLSGAEFLSVFRQVLSALDYMHGRQVVYRDMKPESIILLKNVLAVDAAAVDNSDGSEPASALHVKLLDFGWAKVLSDLSPAQMQTLSGGLPANRVYMSPEQFRGLKTDCRSDIYSLACVMFECLVGKPLFCGEETGELLSKHLSVSPAELLRTAEARPLSPALKKFLAGALCPEPSGRYASAELMLRALNKLNENDVSLSAAKRSGRLFAPAVLSGGLLLLFILAALMFSLGNFHAGKRHVDGPSRPPGAELKKSGQQLLKEAVHLQSQGNLSQALERAREAQQLALTDWHTQCQAWQLIGDYSARLDRIEDAVHAYEEGIKINRHHLSRADETYGCLNSSLAGRLFDLRQFAASKQAANEALLADEQGKTKLSNEDALNCRLLLMRVAFKQQRPADAVAVSRLIWKRLENQGQLMDNDVHIALISISDLIKNGQASLAKTQVRKMEVLWPMVTQPGKGALLNCVLAEELCNDLAMKKEARFFRQQHSLLATSTELPEPAADADYVRNIVRIGPAPAKKQD